MFICWAYEFMGKKFIQLFYYLQYFTILFIIYWSTAGIQYWSFSIVDGFKTLKYISMTFNTYEMCFEEKYFTRLVHLSTISRSFRGDVA